MARAEDAVRVTKEKAKENSAKNELKQGRDGELGKLYSGIASNA